MKVNFPAQDHVIRVMALGSKIPQHRDPGSNVHTFCTIRPVLHVTCKCIVITVVYFTSELNLHNVLLSCSSSITR